MRPADNTPAAFSRQPKPRGIPGVIRILNLALLQVLSHYPTIETIISSSPPMHLRRRQKEIAMWVRRTALAVAILLTLGVLAALCVLAPIMHPIRRATVADFWQGAVSVNIGGATGELHGDAVAERDGRFVCAGPGLDDVWMEWVPVDEAMRYWPAAEAELDALTARQPDHPAAIGYQRWKSKTADQQMGVVGLNRAITTAHSEELYRENPTWLRVGDVEAGDRELAERAALKMTWYWATFCFEFLFFSGHHLTLYQRGLIMQWFTYLRLCLPMAAVILVNSCTNANIIHVTEPNPGPYELKEVHRVNLSGIYNEGENAVFTVAEIPDTRVPDASSNWTRGLLALAKINATTGQQVWQTPLLTHDCTAVAVSHAAGLVASASRDDGVWRVKFWDTQTGGRRGEIVQEIQYPDLLFSADGATLFVIGEHRIDRYQPRTLTKVGTVALEKQGVLPLNPPGVRLAMFSPDMSRVVTYAGEEELVLCDASTGAEIKRIIGTPHGTGSPLADGRHVATGGGEVGVVGGGPPFLREVNPRESEARVWDVETGKQILSLPGHTNPITLVLAMPTTCPFQFITWSHEDDAIRLWDINSAQCVGTYRPEHAGGRVIQGVTLSEDRKLIHVNLSDAHGSTTIVLEPSAIARSMARE
jgi:hypothetical protein